MIIRLLVKIIKLIVFVCIVLYAVSFLLQALFDGICPAIHNFFETILNTQISGVGTVGGIVALVVGGLILLGVFDDSE